MASDRFTGNSLLRGVTQNLAEELFHFANRKPRQSGLYSKLLIKADDLRVLLVAMDVDALMKEHHTDGTTTIQVLQGVLCIRIQEKPHALRAGQILTLEPQLKHDIDARDASSFLVTIAWPTSNKRRALPHRAHGS